jgi:hypothetical protein
VDKVMDDRIDKFRHCFIDGCVGRQAGRQVSR